MAYKLSKRSKKTYNLGKRKEEPKEKEPYCGLCACNCKDCDCTSQGGCGKCGCWETDPNAEPDTYDVLDI